MFHICAGRYFDRKALKPNMVWFIKFVKVQTVLTCSQVAECQPLRHRSKIKFPFSPLSHDNTGFVGLSNGFSSFGKSITNDYNTALLSLLLYSANNSQMFGAQEDPGLYPFHFFSLYVAKKLAVSIQVWKNVEKTGLLFR